MKKFKLPKSGIYCLTVRLQSVSAANTPYSIEFGRWVEFWGAFNGNSGATQQLYLTFPDANAYHIYDMKPDTPGTGTIERVTSGVQLTINTSNNLILRRPIILRTLILRTINNTTLHSFNFLFSEMQDSNI